jgi:hypothetical protein
MAKFTGISIHIRRWTNSKDKVTEKLITDAIPYSYDASRKAYHYAQRCLKKRWPQGEKCILKHGHGNVAYLYAKNIIKGRWRKAEPFIAKDEHSSYLYSKYVLKGRFPLFEKTFEADQRKDQRRSYHYFNAYHLVRYARDFLKSRLPKKIEDKILANSPDAAAEYAVKVMKSRWRAAEKKIAKSATVNGIDLYIRSLKSVKERRDFRRFLLVEVMADSPTTWYACNAKRWIERNEKSENPVIFDVNATEPTKVEAVISAGNDKCNQNLNLL